MDRNEQLIEKVKSHKCLYDPNDTNYKNAGYKLRVWKVIAKQLNENCEATKSKWKNMRDSYMRYKKNVKDKAGSEKKTSKYVWSRQLSFLDSSINTRPSTSNIEIADSPPSISMQEWKQSSEDISCSPKPIMPTELILNDSPIPSDSIDSPPTVPQPQLPPSRRKIQRTREEIALNKIVEYLVNKKPKTRDATDYLFLSYAETFKKLSPRKQAMVKIELSKLFADAEMSENYTITEVTKFER